MADTLQEAIAEVAALQEGPAKLLICWGAGKCPHGGQPPDEAKCQVCYVVEANDPRTGEEIARDMGRPQ